MNRIGEGIVAVGPALFIEPLSLLVIGDLQLGKEEELRAAGHLVIDEELARMKRRLMRLLKQTGARRLLIDGDIKQEFSRINRQEWGSVLGLFDAFNDLVNIIFVKGNHDTMLHPILAKRGLVAVDHFTEEGFLFCHGHAIPPAEEIAGVHTIVIGHEHPAVRFDDGVRRETAKCFLSGPWKGPDGRTRQLIVLPSFSEITIGSDVLTGTSLGPFLQDVQKKKFAVFVVVENSVLRFGTIGDIEAAMKEHE